MSTVSVQDILLALAGNPALLPEHIDLLITTADELVLRELAQEQRLTLAHTEQLATSGQPEMVLMLIKSGNMPVEQIPADDPWALLAGIRRDDAPEAWLPLLASWPDVAVRRALAEHATDRDDIAQLVAGDQDCAVAAGAARLWELPEEMAGQLARRPEACIRIALASSRHVPAAILTSLIDSYGESTLTPCPHWPDFDTALRELRLGAAANPHTPLDEVVPFAERPDPALAAVLAQRPGLPDELYGNLLALQDENVTARVASNWAAPADLLRRLYDADNGRWRELILGNQRTPLDLLIRHSRAGGTPHTDFHPDLTGLCSLARDSDPRVRLVAAASFRLPPDVRDTLINDADFDVAMRAVCHNSASARQIRTTAARYGPRVFPELAGHPCCPPDVLLAIAGHEQSSAEAIINVAMHEASPPVALDLCMQHPHALVYVACNPSAEPEMLHELAGHRDLEVVLEVARNPSMPRSAGYRVLQRLAIPAVVTLTRQP